METNEKISSLELETRHKVAVLIAASLEGITTSGNVRERELEERWLKGDISTEEYMNAIA